MVSASVLPACHKPYQSIVQSPAWTQLSKFNRGKKYNVVFRFLHFDRVGCFITGLSHEYLIFLLRTTNTFSACHIVEIISQLNASIYQQHWYSTGSCIVLVDLNYHGFPDFPESVILL